MTTNKIKIGQQFYWVACDTKKTANANKTVTVVKVGRKFITLDNGFRACKDSLVVEQDYRGISLGVLFADQQSYLDALTVHNGIIKVIDYLDRRKGYIGNGKISTEQINDICNILGIQNEYPIN